MADLLFASLLTLSLGSLLCLPLISVREIGRGFFTLWTAIVGSLSGLALLLRAAGMAGSAATNPGTERVPLLLVLSLVLLGVFWLTLRVSAIGLASLTLVASALVGGLVLREIALAPHATVTRSSEASEASSPEVAVAAPSTDNAEGPRAVPETGRDEGGTERSDAGQPDQLAGGEGRSERSDAGPARRSAGREEPVAPPVSATDETLSAHGAIQAALRVTNLLVSALAVGLVTVAMVLGHWYLVQPKLAIAPLRRLCDVFVFVLLLRLTVSIWGIVTSLRAGHPILQGNDPIPWEALVLSQRVLFGFGGSLVLAVMIRKTVALRSTMSATGLLYIAILFVWVGEFLSIYLDQLTGGALVV